jgi:hypothetical protein
MRECIGPECGGCSSGNCYAKGGAIGVHHSEGDEDEIDYGRPGESKVGANIRSEYTPKHQNPDASERSQNKKVVQRAKDEHYKVLGQMHSMKKPNLYAEGGAVDSWTKREDNERGVHQRFGRGNGSKAGHFVKSDRDFTPEQDKGYSMESAKREHKKVLGEMRGMPKPKLYAQGGQVQSNDDVPEPNKKNAADMQKGAESGATSASEAWGNIKSGLGFAEGGEVADGEPEMDEELKHAMGGEFMDAMERKDRKGIMSALEAIVLSCRGKE